MTPSASGRKPLGGLVDHPLRQVGGQHHFGDPRAVPVLADWLQRNLFGLLVWSPEFVTHTIKVLSGQSGLDTLTFTYRIDEKIDALLQVGVSASSARTLAQRAAVTGGPRATAVGGGACDGKVVVTGIDAMGIERDIEFVQGDIRDAAAVDAAMRGIDEVHHLAYVNGTATFYSAPEFVLDVGVKGILNVIDACRRQNVGCLVLASSSEVYQSPPQVPTAEDVPLVVLDEIHKERRWKRNLKGIFDTLKSPCHFLVTGSARLDAHRKGSDSLLGRHYPFRLHPFSLRELDRADVPRPDPFLESLFTRADRRDDARLRRPLY